MEEFLLVGVRTVVILPAILVYTLQPCLDSLVNSICGKYGRVCCVTDEGDGDTGPSYEGDM